MPVGRSRHLYAWITLLYLLLSICWFYSGNYTWDDDAIGRYWNTEVAGREPSMFLSSWNRPLFVWVFYLPVYFFGKAGVAFGMSLLTAMSGILLYQSARKWALPNPELVVVFHLFQTFLFGISRDAMTEPLASFFISAGIWSLSHRRYALLAIAGSFLPLARTETILLLPFWTIPLIQAKKYYWLPLLGTGLFLWWLAYYCSTGNEMSLFNDITQSGKNENRYGRTAVSHHLSKLVYVVGPVVFTFLGMGLLTGFKRLLSCYFIVLQLLTGFLVYVTFSSFLDIGQSGGALRNLITLAPFFSVLALLGCNYWTGAAGFSIPAPPTNSRSSSGKQRITVLHGKGRRVLICVYLFFLLLVAANHFSNKLLLRQIYDPEVKDYSLVLFLLAVAFVLIAGLFLRTKRFLIFGISLFVLQAGFTLWFENPGSHKNIERQVMNQLIDVLDKTGFYKKKVFVNHPWFYWASGRNNRDTIRSGRLDSRFAQSVQPGDLIIWEPHYTSKDYGNFSLGLLTNDTAYIPVFATLTENDELTSMVFIRSGTEQADSFFTRYKRFAGADKIILGFQGAFERDKKGNYRAAIDCFDQLLKLDPLSGEAYFQRAVCYSKTGQQKKACDDLSNASRLGIKLDAQSKAYCQQLSSGLPDRNFP